MEKELTHNFVRQDGYNICTTCGIAEEAHYWNKDQTHEVMKRFEYFQTKEYKNSNKWKRMLEVNKRIDGNMNNLYREILSIINLLPLSPKMKKNVHDIIVKKDFKSYPEVCEGFYKLICILDLPITSTEFLKILHIGRVHGFKPLTKLKNIESVRKYYWYISQQVEKARKLLNFSHEDGQRIYKIVFNYYNTIRFRMLKSSKPPSLIKNLIYYTIREKLEPNQQHFNKTNFNLKNLSYITYLVRYLKQIKKDKLDTHFSEKLNISIRNKKLEAKL